MLNLCFSRKNKLADKDVPLKDAFIYIAAPSKETEAVEKMRKSLKKDKISVYYGDNLQNFLEKRHKGCPRVVYRSLRDLFDF